jgi:hypothetical protein
MLDRRGRWRDWGVAGRASVGVGATHSCVESSTDQLSLFDQPIELFPVRGEQTEFFIAEVAYIEQVRGLVRGLCYRLLVAQGVVEGCLCAPGVGGRRTIVLGCGGPGIVFEGPRTFALGKNLRVQGAFVTFAFFRRCAASVLPIN